MDPVTLPLKYVWWGVWVSGPSERKRLRSLPAEARRGLPSVAVYPAYTASVLLSTCASQVL